MTVREVHGVLGTQRMLAYTTLVTVLDRLARKGVVERVREGRVWSYTVAASREQLTAETMRRTLDDLGSPDRRSALLLFLNDSSPAELTELRSAWTSSRSDTEPTGAGQRLSAATAASAVSAAIMVPLEPLRAGPP